MSRSIREVKEFFERVAGVRDAVPLTYYDERVIEKMDEDLRRGR